MTSFFKDCVLDPIDDKVNSIISTVKNDLMLTNQNVTILMILDKDFDYKTLDRIWYKSLKTKCKNTIPNYKTQTIDFIIETEKQYTSHKKICHIEKHLHKHLYNVGSVKHNHYVDFNDICSKLTNSVVVFDYCILSSKFIETYTGKTGLTLLYPTVNGNPPNINQNGVQTNILMKESVTMISKLNNLAENKAIIQSSFPNNSVVSKILNAVSLLDTFYNITNKDSKEIVSYDPNLPGYLAISGKFLTNF
jgi:hypothetical protein